MTTIHLNADDRRSLIRIGSQVLVMVTIIALPLGCGDGSPSTASTSSPAAKPTTPASVDPPQSPPSSVTTTDPVITGSTPTEAPAAPSTIVVDIWTPAAMGEIATLRTRLKKAGDPNALDPTFGVSALQWAADFGKVDAMKAILEAGGNVDVRSRERGTPLIGAAFFGRPESVRLLLEAGADPKAMNKDGITPLDALDVPWEFTRDIIEFLEIPLDRGALEAGRRACRPLLEEALK